MINVKYMPLRVRVKEAVVLAIPPDDSCPMPSTVTAFINELPDAPEIRLAVPLYTPRALRHISYACDAAYRSNWLQEWLEGFGSQLAWMSAPSVKKINGEHKLIRTLRSLVDNEVLATATCDFDSLQNYDELSRKSAMSAMARNNLIWVPYQLNYWVRHAIKEKRYETS